MGSPRLHKWVPSTLGHGDAMCAHCRVTNREAAVIGILNHCDRAPEQDEQKEDADG